MIDFESTAVAPSAIVPEINKGAVVSSFSSDLQDENETTKTTREKINTNNLLNINANGLNCREKYVD